MEQERDEVYERIPWETLERQRGERQWLVYAVAGAVTLGALAYSFTRNQPAAPPQAVVPVTSTLPTVPDTTRPVETPTTVAAPIVVAEADLYAVEPERLIDEAVAHAEWFAIEYMSVDGTEESRRALRSLLPEGIPMPEASDDVQVFVDWARASRVEQTAADAFDVEVIVRSLVSTADEGFARSPTLSLHVPLSITPDGEVVVSGPPVVDQMEPAAPTPVSLLEVPSEITDGVTSGVVVGGIQTSDGQWSLVVMTEDAAGVRRPVSVLP